MVKHQLFQILDMTETLNYDLKINLRAIRTIHLINYFGEPISVNVPTDVSYFDLSTSLSAR
jgi:hypothetical protein